MGQWSYTSELLARASIDYWKVLSFKSNIGLRKPLLFWKKPRAQGASRSRSHCPSCSA
jgi:hypothetical protein